MVNDQVQQEFSLVQLFSWKVSKTQNRSRLTPDIMAFTFKKYILQHTRGKDIKMLQSVGHR